MLQRALVQRLKITSMAAAAGELNPEQGRRHDGLHYADVLLLSFQVGALLDVQLQEGGDAVCVLHQRLVCKLLHMRPVKIYQVDADELGHWDGRGKHWFWSATMV